MISPRLTSSFQAGRPSSGGGKVSTDFVILPVMNQGTIANRMMRSLEEQMSLDDPDDMHDAIVELIPMKRYGTDEEVANLALFLGSDESSFTTGSIYILDGGFTAA